MNPSQSLHHPLRSVLLVYNAEKPNVETSIQIVQEKLEEHHIRYHIRKNWVPGNEKPRFETALIDEANQADLVIVFGGDGTLLGVARNLAKTPKPIFGINMGTFGFLTSSQIQTLHQDMDVLLAGQYRTIDRFLLESWVMRDDREVFRSLALNEALITLSKPGRLLNVHVMENGNPALAYRCDGLIVATPTGSSGHSLSAGGPILEPHLAALILTPVSPHSLFNRPLVLDGKQELCIRFQHDTNEKVLILDGQVHFGLHNPDHVFVKRSEYSIPTVTLPHLHFMNVLQHKFNLGNSGIEESIEKEEY